MRIKTPNVYWGKSKKWVSYKTSSQIPFLGGFDELILTWETDGYFRFYKNGYFIGKSTLQIQIDDNIASEKWYHYTFAKFSKSLSNTTLKKMFVM